MTPKQILDEVKEALWDTLIGSVDARVYPDGPCLDKEVRDDVRAALAKLDSLEMVEVMSSKLDELDFDCSCADAGTYHVNRACGHATFGRPALLLTKGDT